MMQKAKGLLHAGGDAAVPLAADAAGSVAPLLISSSGALNPGTTCYWSCWPSKPCLEGSGKGSSGDGALLQVGTKVWCIKHVAWRTSAANAIRLGKWRWRREGQLWSFGSSDVPRVLTVCE